MKFTKIKFRPFEIEYESQPNGSVEPDVISIKLSDIPAPDFMSAFGALRTPALEMMDLPKDDLENIQVDALVIKEKQNRSFYSFTGIRYLKEGKLTMKFSTPSLATEASDPDLQLPKGANALIQAVLDQAEEYMKGKRAQMNLFSIETKSA